MLGIFFKNSLVELNVAVKDISKVFFWNFKSDVINEKLTKY